MSYNTYIKESDQTTNEMLPAPFYAALCLNAFLQARHTTHSAIIPAPNNTASPATECLHGVRHPSAPFVTCTTGVAAADTVLTAAPACDDVA